MKRNERERRLTLLDHAEWMALAPKPEFINTYREHVIARRYVFDHDASRRVGELMRDCMDLLVDNIEFARPPYPVTYLEFDSRDMWKAWRPDQDVSGETRDERVGYLIVGDSVMVLAESKRIKPNVAICGMSFRINKPQSIPMITMTGLDEELADKCAQAYVLAGQRIVDRVHDYKPDHLDDRTWVYLPDLPAHWSHKQIASHFDLRPIYSGLTTGNIVEQCFLGGGDPMIAVTMLLLLNAPSRFINLATVEGTRGLYKGKVKSFKEHHVVTIKLDADEHVRKLLEHTDRASPIAHDVEGHWKHYNKSKNCNHHFENGAQAWEPVGPARTSSGDYKRYWCPLCLQRRTWTEAHTRGDALRGLATKEYIVTE